MKKIGTVLMTLLSTSAFADGFIHATLYTSHIEAFAQGSGATEQDAHNNAVKLIPMGYRIDPSNSPAVACTINVPVADCILQGGLITETIPVVR